MNSMNPEHLTTAPWAEKYRPKSIEECILPKGIKSRFQEFVKKQTFPNLLLNSTSPGSGKTSASLALCHDLGFDTKVVNASLNRGIDTLRTEIMDYVTTFSLDGNRKVVILDEADNTTHDFQASLRNFMEEYSDIAGFILTCNNKQKIIPALHSRCSVIDFIVPNSERKEIITEMFKRVCGILTKENIEYDKKILLEFIVKCFPDNRKMLNELQSFASLGKIDKEILGQTGNLNIEEIAKFLKEKDFTACRKWIEENKSNDFTNVYTSLYDEMDTVVSKQNLPLLITIIGEYSYRHSFVLDSRINVLNCFVEIMRECS